MTSNYLRKFLFTALILVFAIGCSKFIEDPDIKSGQYWLEKGNYQRAVQFFQKAVERNPDRWKGHVLLIEAISQTDDKSLLQSQIRATLSRFPDSARSISIIGPAAQILGDAEYDKIAYSYQQQSLGRQLARKGDKPDILARSLVTACRGKDTVAAMDYAKRFLTVTKGKPLPDSLRMELNFFLGSAWLEWTILELRAMQDPDDVGIIMAQIEIGLIAGMQNEVRSKIQELFRKSPESFSEPGFVRRFAMLFDLKPFTERVIADGWDGCYSPDGKFIVYVKERGKPDDPDPYFYRLDISTGSETPLMKATQQNLRVIAWPVFSPDGKWLYFYASTEKNWAPGRRGIFSLYRIRPQWEANAQKLTDADILPVSPFFSNDGNILLVRRDLGSVRASIEVIRLDPQNKRLSSVVRISEPATAATFSHNGDSLIFITDRGLMRRSLTGGAVSIDLQTSGLGMPFISPDGHWLLLLAGINEHLLVDRHKNEYTHFGIPAVEYASINGNRILVTRERNRIRKLIEYDIGKPVDVSSGLVNKLKGN